MSRESLHATHEAVLGGHGILVTAAGGNDPKVVQPRKQKAGSPDISELPACATHTRFTPESKTAVQAVPPKATDWNTRPTFAAASPLASPSRRPFCEFLAATAKILRPRRMPSVTTTLRQSALALILLFSAHAAEPPPYGPAKATPSPSCRRAA